MRALGCPRLQPSLLLPVDPLLDSSRSASPASPEWDDQAAGDAVVGAMTEESFQACSDDSTTERDTPASSEESTGKTEDLCFLKQLWKIAHSDKFQSIQWVDEGVFVALTEEMFKKEVLARRGLGRVFELESMESFHHQLNLHRLRELPEVSDLSNSGEEFPAEDAATPAPRKAHQFLNRDGHKCPHLHFFLRAFLSFGSTQTPSQAAAPRLPDPAGAAGRESFWAAPSLAPPPSSQAPAGLRHRTRLHLPHHSCQRWHRGWAFPPSPPCSPAQRLGCSPGLASLPPATPGWQCPCRQQPLPRPRQRHPTATAQQPHVVPPAPAPPTLRLQVMGLDPAWHMVETV
uniref:HSF-type DNA-binding domain-containing protein n=1 Tax=Aquila chrysaetos chrysaetos TaxID=223781 RepID=A0A663EVF3_AQUCH